MAIPNLNNPIKVEGKNVLVSDVPASATSYLTNSADSGKTLRLSSIYCSNIDGANAADISVYMTNAQNNTGYLAKTVSVPADASLLPLTKDSNIYMMEGDSLYLQCSASGDVSAIIVYEEIS
jgi:hypothetical protein